MSTYTVTNKISGEVVYRYIADSPVEWIGMEFVNFDHIIVSIETPTPIIPIIKSWTPFEFLRRFTMTEQVNIRTAAKSNMVIDNLLQTLVMAPAVRSDAPDILMALPMFEQAGLIASGRASEILNGN